MMEQRSQMLRQMRLTKTEREREVSGLLSPGQGQALGDAIRWEHQNDSPQPHPFP